MSYYYLVGRFRSMLAVVAMLATCFSANPAPAGRSLDVEILGATGSFSPPVLIADESDQIVFNLSSQQGIHDLISYATVGALDPVTGTRGPASNFATGVMRGEPGRPARFGFEFFGGTVRYLCQRHSKINLENGICDGMCGVITDEDTPPVPPVIDAPTRTIQERPATISGTAEPLTIVTVREGRTYDGGTGQNQALTDENGVWHAKAVNFGTSAGSKPLVARAVRGVGYVSADSATVYYNYLPDRVVPTIEMDGVDLVQFDTVRITGRAQDNIGMRAVIIRFSRLDAGGATRLVLTRTFQLGASCAPACPNLAANQSVRWSFTSKVDQFKDEPPGTLYEVQAIAVDTSDLVAATPVQNFVRVGAPCPQVPPLGPPVGPLVPTTPCVTASIVPPVLSSPSPSPSPTP